MADEGDTLEHPDGDSDRWLADVSRDACVTVEDGTLTTDTADDDWEAVIVGQAQGELWEDDDEVDDSGDNEPDSLPVITARDALIQIKNIVGFALGAVCCIRQTALTEQKTITDFFNMQ